MKERESFNLPESLVDIARRAGISVPNDFVRYNLVDYKHWYLLCLLQLERPIPTADAPLKNALAIRAIPNATLVSLQDSIEYVRDKLL